MYILANELRRVSGVQIPVMVLSKWRRVELSLLEKLCKKLKLLVVKEDLGLLSLLPEKSREEYSRMLRASAGSEKHLLADKHDPWDPVLTRLSGWDEKELARNVLDCRWMCWKRLDGDQTRRELVDLRWLEGESFERAEMLLDLRGQKYDT